MMSAPISGSRTTAERMDALPEPAIEEIGHGCDKETRHRDRERRPEDPFGHIVTIMQNVVFRCGIDRPAPERAFLMSDKPVVKIETGKHGAQAEQSERNQHRRRALMRLMRMRVVIMRMVVSGRVPVIVDMILG